MSRSKAKDKNAAKEELEFWSEKLQTSNKVEDHREVIGQILSALSLGRDVSSIFPLVCRFAATKDIKLKKVVCLFVLNYHKMNPDTPVQVGSVLDMDSQDREQAVIRALAIRTMGNLCTHETLQVFTNAIGRALGDTDPFVRKTAATAVAKIYRVSPEMVIQMNMLLILKELLSDGNQAVVAAAASSLVDVATQLSPEQLYGIFGIQDIGMLFNWQEVQALLTALTSSTEWSAMHILTAIANYGQLPLNYEEADATIQRLANFLRHNNPAVSLMTINLVLKYIYADPPILNTEQCYRVQGMCVGPLLSFVGSSTSPESQWIALRCLRLVASAFINQEQENPFSKQIRLFFVKYNDPLYIKLEKIEMLALLADSQNCQEVVMELSEYARDVDPQFVRASIRALGAVAIRVPTAADLAVHRFVKLITGQGNEEEESERENQHYKFPDYAAQELMIATQLIFRRYPERYEGIIGILCETIVTLDDPDAKAALIWIIGEYANRIEGSEEVISDLVGLSSILTATEEDYDPNFKGSFLDESAVVQLQFITSCTKLFLHVPTIDTQRLLQHTLQLATERAESPDVRQRASFYWRLLGVDPTLQTARAVLFSQKAAPQITDGMPDAIRATLVRELGSVSCVMREMITDTVYSGPDVEEAIRILDAVGTNVQEMNYDEIVGAKTDTLSSTLPPPLTAGTTISSIATADTATLPAAFAPAHTIPDVTLPTAPVRQVQPATNLPAFGSPVTDLLGQASTSTAAPAAPITQPPAPDKLAALIGGPIAASTPAPAPAPTSAPVAAPAPVVAPSTEPAPSFNAASFITPKVETPAPPAPEHKPELIMPPAAAPPAVPPTSTQLLAASLPYFSPDYPFATVQNAPVRVVNDYGVMAVSVSWTRENQKPLLLLTVQNKGTVPFTNLLVGFAPNGLGISPISPQLAIASVEPGQKSNGGEPVLVPVQFKQDPNTQFNQARLSQPDPQCTGNLNLLTFAIKCEGAPGPCQFQCKIPIHVLASETSNMHGPDRNLINPAQAVQQFNKNWGLVQDSLAHRDTSSLTYASLGISGVDEVAAVIVRKAKRANFNLVEMQPTSVSLLMSIPLAAYPQNLPVLIRVGWRASANGQGVDLCALMKIPPIGVMCMAYVAQSLKFSILK